jgi:putative ABC transport system ATP-binding protein
VTEVIALSGVGKIYLEPTSVAALEDIDLHIGTGETVAITGPSGSGKSTMLSILGTLEKPTTGQVRLTGIDVSALGDAELSAIRAYRIGFVFQRFHLLAHLTVLENVATGLLYRGLPSVEAHSAARVALERVGLSHRGGHHPLQLSGGEQQRAAIARAIVGKPTIVLADEPTGNLDSVTSGRIMDVLTSVADARTTVIVITHDSAIAQSMGRRISLRDGRIVQDSGPL